MKTITAFLVVVLGASCALSNEVSYDARTKSYTSSPESATATANRQSIAAARAADMSVLTQNRSNAVSKVNSSLATFELSAISSKADVTLAWRTNIHAVVSAKYDNASTAQKDDVLLAAIKLYESLVTLLTTP